MVRDANGHQSPLLPMSCLRFILLSILVFTVVSPNAHAASRHVLSVSGTRFLSNDQPFPYTGISFFNAIYNPAFNQSAEERQQWLTKFQKYGINVLRVWCQWDSKLSFIDSGPENTLYDPDGRLREKPLQTLKAIITDADEAGMVIQVVLFSSESSSSAIHQSGAACDRAVAGVARELLPCRNVTIQVWNESSDRVLDHVETIREIDPDRLVTNSPGHAGILGDWKQNDALDFLTPHISRQNAGRPWEIAPKEIAYLLALYDKPVVDDEPARNGTSRFGGPTDATSPYDHIIQIQRVWDAGGLCQYCVSQSGRESCG
ncbi:MAG: hypothetical protein ACREIA_15595 [Opitutaceae bacterium]